MRRRRIEDPTVHELRVAAFAEACLANYELAYPGSTTRGDVEASIEAAREMADTYDGYTIREGERLFRSWLAQGLVR